MSKTDNQAMESAPPAAFPFQTNNPSQVPGSTLFDPQVVAAIAGYAVTQVPGVARLGNTAGVLRSISDAMRSTASVHATGVNVQAGQHEAIIDLEIITIYGCHIPYIVQQVRETVAQELFDQIGLVAKAVNMTVVGIEFPANLPPPSLR